MSLVEAQPEKTFRISDIISGADARKRLSSMGIRVNDSFIKIGNAKWGPVLVQNVTTHSTKIALGRGLAEKIIIEYAE